ncbi:hypothetical protein BV25DRAFT_970973 [Artomyces pyxidatus]|uniref:Uncharacterized protein n=1 Tax=Artomyces pyxidatus TaxID=48021 RepID=A0ACB8SWF1_9AGAM|nr:hypothetical protein BV25DRAFT_970973 [Artomyces pyxidatus]
MLYTVAFRSFGRCEIPAEGFLDNARRLRMHEEQRSKYFYRGTRGTLCMPRAQSCGRTNFLQIEDDDVSGKKTGRHVDEELRWHAQLVARRWDGARCAGRSGEVFVEEEDHARAGRCQALARRAETTWSRQNAVPTAGGATPNTRPLDSPSTPRRLVLRYTLPPTTMSEKLDAPTSSSTDTGIGSNKEGISGSGPKAIIKNVDMSEDMQQESVDIASAALEKYNIEKDIAAQIKKEFDRRHGPTWHVVVGKNFGSYVTHETKHFIYFYVGSLAILIWKS